MSFEEEFPSLIGKERLIQTNPLPTMKEQLEAGFTEDEARQNLVYSMRSYGFAKEDVKKFCLDKQRVKEAIIKHTQGTKYIRHEDCDRPCGDECGYCEFCGQKQSELQSKIFKELGLE